MLTVYQIFPKYLFAQKDVLYTGAKNVLLLLKNYKCLPQSLECLGCRMNFFMNKHNISFHEDPWIDMLTLCCIFYMYPASVKNEEKARESMNNRTWSGQGKVNRIMSKNNRPSVFFIVTQQRQNTQKHDYIFKALAYLPKIFWMPNLMSIFWQRLFCNVRSWRAKEKLNIASCGAKISSF